MVNCFGGGRLVERLSIGMFVMGMFCEGLGRESARPTGSRFAVRRALRSQLARASRSLVALGHTDLLRIHVRAVSCV